MDTPVIGARLISGAESPFVLAKNPIDVKSAELITGPTGNMSGRNT